MVKKKDPKHFFEEFCSDTECRYRVLLETGSTGFNLHPTRGWYYRKDDAWSPVELGDILVAAIFKINSLQEQLDKRPEQVGTDA